MNKISKSLEQATAAELGRALAAKRQKPTGGPRPGAGRKRSDAPRCPCGASTLTRAKIRKFDCCHKAGVRLPEEFKHRIGETV